MKADLVLLGGKIITMNPAMPFAQAIAVKDGKILSIGKDAEISGMVDSGTKILKLEGETVTPGFIDCHVHLTQTGLDFTKIDLSSCQSIKDVMTLVAEQAKKVKPGQWIMGASYQDFSLIEKRPPLRQELDTVAPNNPVWLSRLDTHSGVLSSKGIEELKIDESKDGIGRDEKGQFNGLVFGETNNFVRGIINSNLDIDTRREALQRACEKMLSVGVTTVHAFEGGSLFSDEDTNFVIEEIVNLPIDIVIFNQLTDIKKTLSQGLPRIGGDILIDGTIGSRTAALSQPYADAPDEHGILYFDKKELEEFVVEAHSKGLQISVHAIGDAAIEQILTAYEKAQKEYYRENHRHRIEHFSLPAPSHIERSIKLGIIHSLQVSWCKPWVYTQDSLPTRLGVDRSDYAHPVGSIILNMGRICGGSDSPIVPVNPMAGIFGTVNHFRPEERLSRMAGLSFFTTQAAYSCFEENIKGRIAPGYNADIAILNSDFFETPSDELENIKVITTLVKGEVKYSIRD